MEKEYQKAYKEAQKQLKEQKVQELVNIIKGIFEGIDRQQETIKKSKENLRQYEQDLKDLKAGKIKRIKERIEKGESKITEQEVKKLEVVYDTSNWTTATALSYPTTSGNIYTIK